MPRKFPFVSLIVIIAVGIVLFFLGFQIWGMLFENLLPQMEGLQYHVSDFSGAFASSIVFSITLAVTPLLLFLIWRSAPIYSAARKLISILIVCAAILLAIIAQRLKIISDVSPVTSAESPTSVATNSIHFDRYILCGMLVGIVLSYFLLRQSPKKPSYNEFLDSN